MSESDNMLARLVSSTSCCESGTSAGFGGMGLMASSSIVISFSKRVGAHDNGLNRFLK